MDLLTDTTSWSLLLGVAMPWLVAVVNRPWWPTWARRWVAIIASVLGGVLVCLATGAFGDGSGLTILGACLTVLIASQAVYGHLFPDAVRRVELFTSGRQAEPEPAPEPVPVPAAEPERETYAGYDDEPGAHSEERHA